jgi:phosphatidylglycerol:prolipoprotein diacylglycerol transferase
LLALIPWFEVPIFHIPLGSGRTLPIHGFGILVAIGFVVGGRVAMDRARATGLDPQMINRVITWLVVGTFVGGHVGYGLMYRPEEYFAEPVKFLQVWQGLSSYGGFAVCVPLAIWFFRKERLAVLPYLDALAWGMTVGWFFGRMGCFVAHDHPGTPTDFFLGVVGTCPGAGRDIACHDMGLYEAFWSIGMYGLFAAVDRVRRWPAGFYTALIGLAYGPVRFAMDTLRPEQNDPRYAGFTPGQWWSIALALFCAPMLFRLLSKQAQPDTGS